MSNYTPAPWRAHKLPNGSHHIIADHWGASVAVTMFPDNGSEGREANALLIAAAPDMLRVLEGLLKNPEGLRDNEALLNIRRLVDRATGADQ